MSKPQNVPDNVLLSTPLANLLAAYVLDGASLPSLAFVGARTLRDTNSGEQSPIDGSVSLTDGGTALLTLSGRASERLGALGSPVEIGLSDGSVIHCDDPFVTRQGTSIQVGKSIDHTTEIELREWRWETREEPVAWVAVIHGPKLEASNLLVRRNDNWNGQSLRLCANAAWHFTRKGAFGKHSCVAIVDTGGNPIEHDTLWHDFAALEFVFGTPLSLEVLIGVNNKNEPVAAYGASFGYRYRRDANHEPPLPDDRDHAWLAVAFPLVAQALAAPKPNPITIGTCGYVDSTIGHIDGQYLFAQVALEAVAYRLGPDERPIVKDSNAWKTWAKSQRKVLEEHATDPSAVNTLAKKLSDAARPTTSRLVKRTFERMGLEIPDEGVEEIDGRNLVAHTLSMTDHQPYEIERDVRRIRIIRSLLAGIVLRHVGYTGALAGWDLDPRRWRMPATWFSVTEEATHAARTIYEAIADSVSSS